LAVTSPVLVGNDLSGPGRRAVSPQRHGGNARDKRGSTRITNTQPGWDRGRMKDRQVNRIDRNTIMVNHLTEDVKWKQDRDKGPRHRAVRQLPAWRLRSTGLNRTRRRNAEAPVTQRRRRGRAVRFLGQVEKGTAADLVDPRQDPLEQPSEHDAMQAKVGTAFRTGTGRPPW